MIALGIATILNRPAETGIGSSLIASGTVVIIFVTAKLFRSVEGPEQDERTRRIGAWGISYSWFVTFMSLFVLFWLDVLGVFALDVHLVLMILMLEMALSVRIFQWYFFRKGDVE
jgi:hypothetical protein